MHLTYKRTIRGPGLQQGRKDIFNSHDLDDATDSPGPPAHEEDPEFFILLLNSIPAMASASSSYHALVRFSEFIEQATLEVFDYLAAVGVHVTLIDLFQHLPEISHMCVIISIIHSWLSRHGNASLWRTEELIKPVLIASSLVPRRGRHGCPESTQLTMIRILQHVLARGCECVPGGIPYWIARYVALFEWTLDTDLQNAILELLVELLKAPHGASPDEIGVIGTLFARLHEIGPCLCAMLELSRAFFGLGPAFEEFFFAVVRMDLLLALFPELADPGTQKEFLALAALVPALLRPTDPRMIEAVMSEFQWEMLLVVLREGKALVRRQCFELISLLFEQYPPVVLKDGATAVVRSVLVALEGGPFRDKERALMPLCKAVRLADGPIIEMMVDNGFIENMIPFLDVTHTAVAALHALDSVASYAERCRIAEVNQRLLDSGMAAHIEELVASEDADIADAAAAFLAARRANTA
jgi:hypothetical protein